MTISIALATFNEESKIQNCLDSVKWADEIVIVDGTSTDDTAKIIQKNKKIKLITTSNKPIFHINKKMAIDACTSDWILQLDADEVVSPELHQEIVKIMNHNPPENGYWLPRKNYFLSSFLTKGGQYPDYTLRLYRRGFGNLPAKNVHEQAEVKGTVGYLKSPLLHYADISFSRYILRNDRYTTLIAHELKDKKLPLNWFNFINYYFFKPVYEFCLIYFRHRGYVDGFPGFVFAFYSALRFPIAYTKYYEINQSK